MRIGAINAANRVYGTEEELKERRKQLAFSILPLYGQGKSHKVIARELSLSPRIVRTILIEQGAWTPSRSGKKDPTAPYSRLRSRVERPAPSRLQALLKANSLLINQTSRSWMRRARAEYQSSPAFIADKRKRDADRMRFLYQNDTEHRLIQLLRKRLNKVAQRGRGYGGNNLEWLGCTPEQLRTHIESQFKHGMAWDNLGVGKGHWNIDHIIPCAAFDFTDPVQAKRCFHYTNMRPLWAIANLKKRDRVPSVHQWEML
jgi:hypothetical protein